MSRASGDDRERDSFQEWRLGIALLFVVILVAAVSATVLQSLGVPLGTEIGVLGGSVLTFLVFSYWYDGRN